jgi:hypothetical protein
LETENSSLEGIETATTGFFSSGSAGTGCCFFGSTVGRDLKENFFLGTSVCFELVTSFSSCSMAWKKKREAHQQEKQGATRT